jgi:hypothetical protein
MNDSEFDDLLRTAKGEVPLPGSFRQGVWHRIESTAAESPRGLAWFQELVAVLVRPWGAAAGVAATVAAGLWLGAASIPEAKDAKVAYAESISPFAHASSNK